MNNIFEYLVQHQAEMLKILEDWVNRDSPSSSKTALDGLSAQIVKRFAGLRVAVENFPQSNYGDHYRIIWGGNERQILILTHFDTVRPLGEAARRPFRIHNGKAIGPGVADEKASIVIALYSLKALIATGQTPKHRLVYLLTSDEEPSSPSSRPIIEAEAQRSDYALVLEPAIGESLTTSRKGVGRFRLEISGIASHSGVDREKGVSAIEEMAYQVIRLHAMNDLPKGITINVGTIQGGSAVNVVASSAYADIDLRVSKPFEIRQMELAFRSLKSVLKGTKIKLTGSITHPPFEETPQNQTLFERTQRVGKRLGLDLTKISSGGGTNANFTSALGVPTLDGLGAVAEGTHAYNEQILIESLPKRASLLAELILDLGRDQ